jgi:hypothetical protein
VISHRDFALALVFLLAIIAIEAGVIRVQAAQIRRMKGRKQ